MPNRPQPSRAIVLAAGHATRMRPLSYAIPKPLLPLWGAPALDRVLRLLADWGVRDVLINLHSRADAIVAHILGRSWPLRIQFSYEPEILGTGGALRKAAWFPGAEPFWLINADIAADLDPAPLIAAYRRPRVLAALWMHPSRGPRTVAMVGPDVVDFATPHPGAPGTATFCGLHLLSAKVLPYLEAAPHSSIIAAYTAALRAGHRVLGVTVDPCYWADLGTPESYLAAHADLANPAAMPDFAAIAAEATVHPAAVVRRSVVLAGAALGAGARLEDAIIGPRCRVSGRARGLVMRAADIPDPALSRGLDLLGWSGRDTLVQVLPPRGSNRRFLRLQRGRDSVILIHYEMTRPENALYALHALFLRELGIPVPRVLGHDAATRVLLLQDLGDQTLQEIFPRRGAESLRRLYDAVIEMTHCLHVEGTRRARAGRLPLSPPFDPALYAWEHKLFLQSFAQPCLRLAPARCRRIARELQGVARVMARGPAALIHRDLQSSNILLHRRTPHFIDFQGMRYGAPAYDLASLLYDPYVELPDAIRRAALARYAALGGMAGAALDILPHAAVQRLTQALGAYGRLVRKSGMEQFRRYVEPARARMAAVLTELPGCEALRELMATPFDCDWTGA